MDASLESGKSYGFMGCNWTVCEFVNDGMTAVLQSHGVTEEIMAWFYNAAVWKW
jgi:hypothetical protein